MMFTVGLWLLGYIYSVVERAISDFILPIRCMFMLFQLLHIPSLP
ncbi:hypothetical protein BN1221_03886c [Brenneria goodwinii]|uniref:Uncharacterized protein n=1 Tax=Brenneria goodwinii TaxID=1109412 RepID=A0A0G4JZN1_9GAMM|nr:hypothetical protein BN1221_03886c [Brenneria goodwinii]